MQLWQNFTLWFINVCWFLKWQFIGIYPTIIIIQTNQVCAGVQKYIYLAELGVINNPYMYILKYISSLYK